MNDEQQAPFARQAAGYSKQSSLNVWPRCFSIPASAEDATKPPVPEPGLETACLRADEVGFRLTFAVRLVVNRELALPGCL